jgi:hypothetical protein
MGQRVAEGPFGVEIGKDKFKIASARSGCPTRPSEWFLVDVRGKGPEIRTRSGAAAPGTFGFAEAVELINQADSWLVERSWKRQNEFGCCNPAVFRVRFLTWTGSPGNFKRTTARVLNVSRNSAGGAKASERCRTLRFQGYGFFGCHNEEIKDLGRYGLAHQGFLFNCC